MPTLTPLYDPVRLIEAKGKYTVQAEIPPESTLTETDIARILDLATWRVDPHEVVEHYEGGRAVLIPREIPITKNGVTLEALQISGIGYREMEVLERGMVSIDDESSFHPPSAHNFMDGKPPGFMGTSHAQGNQIKGSTPHYRATGTYTSPELCEKVEHTRFAAHLPLRLFVVPTVELYGRYLTKELQHEEGNMGFMVTSIPSVHTVRAGNAITARAKYHLTSGGIHSLDQYLEEVSREVLSTIAQAQRELHQEGVAHLQPHLSNLYVERGKIVLVDWATMKKLNGTHPENEINRIIDLQYSALSLGRISQSLCPQRSEETFQLLQLRYILHASRAYAPGKDLAELILAREARGVPPKHLFEALQQWMAEIIAEEKQEHLH